MRIWIWTVLLALVVVLLLLVILFSKITVKVHAAKLNKDEEIKAEIRALFGLVHLRFQVPEIVFRNFKKGFYVHSASGGNLPMIPKQKEEDQDIGAEKMKRLKEIYQIMLQSTSGLKKWFDDTVKHLDVIKLDWFTDFSLREADHTAVMSGVLWSLKNYIVGGLTFRVKMKVVPELKVNPSFGTAPHFATQMDCIAKISLGYAMYAGLTLITRSLKVKGGTKQWLNILFKA